MYDKTVRTDKIFDIRIMQFAYQSITLLRANFVI